MALTKGCFVYSIAAITALLVTNVAAEPSATPGLSDIPHLTIKYYDVHGSSASELREQMKELGPSDPNDHKKMEAVTLWKFKWVWPGYGDEKCELSSAWVDYEITMILPRLADDSQVAQSLKTKWDSYIHALINHERGHAEFVVQHAPDVLAQIKSASCSTADAAAHRVLKEITEHDRAYDAETDHGRKQGIRFP